VTLDADEIADLYRRHARPMLTFFARRTHDPEIAVDLVAETFAAAIQDRHQFRGSSDGEAAGWLFAIARHQLSAWYRRGDVERRAMDRLRIERRELEDAEYERIVELAGLKAQRERVADSLSRLSGTLRAAVRLRVIEELSYAEVAVALAISEQTARARVSRGLRELADELADPEEAEGLPAHG
jgi:RNA polymerase sigma factor (sigma-70 family)